jgi:hypothetical protein
MTGTKTFTALARPKATHLQYSAQTVGAALRVGPGHNRAAADEMTRPALLQSGSPHWEAYCGESGLTEINAAGRFAPAHDQLRIDPAPNT